MRDVMSTAVDAVSVARQLDSQADQLGLHDRRQTASSLSAAGWWQRVSTRPHTADSNEPITQRRQP